MFKIYFLQISEVSKKVLDEKKNELKYKLITNQSVQVQTICRDLLFNYVLMMENIHSEIVYNEYGKPYFRNEKINFNISHSGDYVVLAISDNEIGIDVQKINAMNDLELDRLVRRIYNDNDYNYFYINDYITFFQVWTIKEGYMKAIGLGLINNIRDIVVDYEKHIVSMLNQPTMNYFSLVDYKYSVTFVCNSITENITKDIKNNIIEYDYNDNIVKK